MKFNVENFKVDFKSNRTNHNENTDVHNSEEGGTIEVGKLEVELTPEEILEYIKTAPTIVKDALAFGRDIMTMQRDLAKEESKKVVTD